MLGNQNQNDNEVPTFSSNVGSENKGSGIGATSHSESVFNQTPNPNVNVASGHTPGFVNPNANVPSGHTPGFAETSGYRYPGRNDSRYTRQFSRSASVSESSNSSPHHSPPFGPLKYTPMGEPDQHGRVRNPHSRYRHYQSSHGRLAFDNNLMQLSESKSTFNVPHYSSDTLHSVSGGGQNFGGTMQQAQVNMGYAPPDPGAEYPYYGMQFGNYQYQQRGNRRQRHNHTPDLNSRKQNVLGGVNSHQGNGYPQIRLPPRTESAGSVMSIQSAAALSPMSSGENNIHGANFGNRTQTPYYYGNKKFAEQFSQEAPPSFSEVAEESPSPHQPQYINFDSPEPSISGTSSPSESDENNRKTTSPYTHTNRAMEAAKDSKNNNPNPASYRQKSSGFGFKSDVSNHGGSDNRKNEGKSLRLELSLKRPHQDEKQRKKERFRKRMRFGFMLFAVCFFFALLGLLLFSREPAMPSHNTFVPYGEDKYLTTLSLDKSNKDRWCADVENGCDDFSFIVTQDLNKAKIDVDLLGIGSGSSSRIFEDTTNIYQLDDYHDLAIELTVYYYEPERPTSLRIPLPADYRENDGSMLLYAFAQFEQSNVYDDGGPAYKTYEPLEKVKETFDKERYTWVTIPPTAFHKQKYDYTRTKFVAYIVLGDSLGGSLPSQLNVRLLQDDADCPVQSDVLCPFDSNGCSDNNLVMSFNQYSFLGVAYKAPEDTKAVNQDTKVVKAPGAYQVVQTFLDSQLGKYGVVMTLDETGVHVLYLGLSSIDADLQAKLDKAEKNGVKPKIPVTGETKIGYLDEHDILQVQNLPSYKAEKISRVRVNPCLTNIRDATIEISDVGILKDDLFFLQKSRNNDEFADVKPFYITPSDSVPKPVELVKRFTITSDELRTQTLTIKILPDKPLYPNHDPYATFKVKLTNLIFKKNAAEYQEYCKWQEQDDQNVCIGEIDRPNTDPDSEKSVTLRIGVDPND